MLISHPDTTYDGDLSIGTEHIIMISVSPYETHNPSIFVIAIDACN
jgi:hypothetical protein